MRFSTPEACSQVANGETTCNDDDAFEEIFREDVSDVCEPVNPERRMCKAVFIHSASCRSIFNDSVTNIVFTALREAVLCEMFLTMNPPISRGAALPTSLRM